MVLFLFIVTFYQISTGRKESCSQFHQRFTLEYFVRTSFWQLFLVTFWLWGEIRTKNSHVKRWWNWHLNNPFYVLLLHVYLPFTLFVTYLSMFLHHLSPVFSYISVWMSQFLLLYYSSLAYYFNPYTSSYFILFILSQSLSFKFWPSLTSFSLSLFSSVSLLFIVFSSTL